MELYITIVYKMMAQGAQTQWMRKNYSSSKLQIQNQNLNSVLSLEEPDKDNAEGLKLALENSILKLGLDIKKK